MQFEQITKEESTMTKDNNASARLERAYKAIEDSRNYVVHRRPDEKTNWFFQIVHSELLRRSMRGSFNVVTICNYQSADEIVFSIPYLFLKENILPFAHIERNRRYLFNINKVTYQFLWNRKVKMDGKQFLVD